VVDYAPPSAPPPPTAQKTRRTPGGVAEEDLGRARPRVEAREEERAEVVRARARDRLHARDAAVRDRGRVGAEDEARGRARERGEPRDRQVLVVERLVREDALLRLRASATGRSHMEKGKGHLAHGGQHPRSVRVVAVRADAEVHLLLEFVGLVRRGELEDRVGRREGNVLPRFCARRECAIGCGARGGPAAMLGRRWVAICWMRALAMALVSGACRRRRERAQVPRGDESTGCVHVSPYSFCSAFI
jgi:hypothetical protein